MLVVEFAGDHGGVVQAVERAGCACEGGGDDESHHLGLRDIDADRFRGDPIVAGRHDRASAPGVDQVVDHDKCEDDQDRTCSEVGDPLCARGAHGAVDQVFAALPERKFAFYEAELDPGAVEGDVKVHDQVHHDLPEGQCDDRQIVALELQDGDADEEYTFRFSFALLCPIYWSKLCGRSVRSIR